MAIGLSGRVVIEIDPGLKQRLHAALALNQSSLKAWFVQNATEYVESYEQLGLFRPLPTQTVSKE